MAPWGIFLIVVLGLAIRLLASQQTHIINPDGIYYIHQAKAIYYGQWQKLTSCHLSFVSIYPFLIAAAYALWHHWVFAAQGVSIFFGAATLIPVYLLLGRFFDRTVSAVTLLMFAVLPVFVVGSADVIRGPVCWFFLALGLYFFSKASETRTRCLLFFACISFLVASWARIEALLFILVSTAYLIFSPQEKRLQKGFFFTLPLMAALFFILCGVLFLNEPLEETLRLSEAIHKLSAPMVAYEALRVALTNLISQFSPEEITPYFLHKTRNMVWLVGLGTLVKYMIRAYFYIFFFVFLLGIQRTWRKCKTAPGVLYLSLCALFAFILLFLHVLQTWMMFDRFWAIFILPAVAPLGFGFEKAGSVLNTRLHLKKWVGFSFLCLMILACALPKDLRPRETDKMVFKEIGEFIAERGTDHPKPIRVLTSERSPNWVSFYANLHYPGAPCPMGNVSLNDVAGKGYTTFLKTLIDEGVDYFLYEERYWPDTGFDVPQDRMNNNFKKLGEWHQPDTGRLILYRVTPPGRQEQPS